jgi:hypothetical protein
MITMSIIVSSLFAAIRLGLMVGSTNVDFHMMNVSSITIRSKGLGHMKSLSFERHV